MTKTAKLALPFLASAQAQKHVTVNESLSALDQLVQAGVRSRTEASPPTEVADGDAFIVPEGGETAWNQQATSLVAWTDGAWRAYVPQQGWLAHVADEAGFAVFRDGAWETLDYLSRDDLAEVPMVGVGTRADATNRLAISSPTSLFTHAGGDHRMSINRQDRTSTASVLFQTGYDAAAEVGLVGEDALSLKVSDAEGSWRTALRVDPASGIVNMPHRPLVRAFLKADWHDAAAGTDTGFSNMAAEKGGFTLGSTVNGPGRRLVVPATGTYMLRLQIYMGPGDGFRTVLRSTEQIHLFTQCDDVDSRTVTHGGTVIALLSAGEELYLNYPQGGRCYHGRAHTEVTLLMV